MAKDVYHKLARHLDNLPGGFPSTASGVELRILRRLFSPDQADLATKLSVIPEQAAVIARRAGLEVDQAGKRLDDMAAKGLIFRYAHKDRTYYMAAQYVIGIWEYHVNDLDPELIKDMNEYIPHLFDTEVWRRAPQLRTIPVGKSISAQLEVMPYEQAEELVRKQKKFLVAPCICRREHKMVGEGCDKPEESCLVFGAGVDYYQNNGLGRVIDLAETLDILQRAEEAGLVLQPSNAQRIVNICCCCGCCCQVLKTLKRHPRPASLAASPFVAVLDEAACTGCGVCVERCQMEALSLQGETAVLDPERCIGCGLCVSTCSGEALSLARKPQSPEVPKSVTENYLRLARARGKMGPASLAMTALKSKVDRLLAKS